MSRPNCLLAFDQHVWKSIHGNVSCDPPCTTTTAPQSGRWEHPPVGRGALGVIAFTQSGGMQFSVRMVSETKNRTARAAYALPGISPGGRKLLDATRRGETAQGAMQAHGA